MKGKTWKLKHMNQLKNNDMSSIKKHMDILVVISAIVKTVLTINAFIAKLRKEMHKILKN